MTKNNREKRVRQYLKENDKLLNKHNLIAGLTILFPKAIKVPLLSRIALWVVGKQGGMLDISFKDKK